MIIVGLNKITKCNIEGDASFTEVFPTMNLKKNAGIRIKK